MHYNYSEKPEPDKVFEFKTKHFGPDYNLPKTID